VNERIQTHLSFQKKSNENKIGADRCERRFESARETGFSSMDFHRLG